MNRQISEKTDKQVNRQTNKWTDKQMNRQTNKWTEKQTNEQTNKQMNRQTHEQTNKQTDKQTHEQTNKWTDKQTNKQTNKHLNRQTNEQTNKHMNKQTEGHLYHIKPPPLQQGLITQCQTVPSTIITKRDRQTVIIKQHGKMASLYYVHCNFSVKLCLFGMQLSMLYSLFAAWYYASVTYAVMQYPSVHHIHKVCQNEWSYTQVAKPFQ